MPLSIPVLVEAFMSEFLIEVSTFVTFVLDFLGVPFPSELSHYKVRPQLLASRVASWRALPTPTTRCSTRFNQLNSAPLRRRHLNRRALMLPDAAAPHEVLVFRTSVTCRWQVQQLASVLELAGHWSFDLADCDHVLRVATPTLPATAICRLMNALGFDCEELSY